MKKKGTFTGRDDYKINMFLLFSLKSRKPKIGNKCNTILFLGKMQLTYLTQGMVLVHWRQYFLTKLPALGQKLI